MLNKTPGPTASDFLPTLFPAPPLTLAPSAPFVAAPPPPSTDDRATMRPAFAVALVDRVQRAARDVRGASVLLIVDGDTDDAERCSWSEFIAHNAEDPNVFGPVLALRPGETVRLGGGACPTVDVARLS